MCEPDDFVFLLVVQWSIFVFLFTACAATATGLLASVPGDESSSSPDQKDPSCRENLLVYWDCQGNRHASLDIQPTTDDEYSDAI